MPLETGLHRFVRGLLAGKTGRRHGEAYTLDGQRSAEATTILGLIAQGALSGDEATCTANAQTRAWLKRALLDADAFAAQHRVVRERDDGSFVNMAESPLVRLGSGRTPFLEPHHVHAGERVRQLVERAQLQPRVTMTYSGSRTAGGPQHKNDISDMAVDARRRLDELHDLLPRDCASVVVDVCGFLKGLQDVERDRRWPRRSAKLVLRIGLDQLALYYGLTPSPAGRGRRLRTWMDTDARPSSFE